MSRSAVGHCLGLVAKIERGYSSHREAYQEVVKSNESMKYSLLPGSKTYSGCEDNWASMAGAVISQY